MVTCHSRPEFLDAIRRTWAPLVPATADVFYFFGRGATREPLKNEVFLDCDDSYDGLPNKVQEIMRWAYNHGYDFALKCDDDVVLRPEALLSSGFTNNDFTGCKEPSCKPGEIKTPWGFCYWLSRRSMELVINSPLPGLPGSIHSHTHNNDEAWISTILHYKGIFLSSDERYFLYLGRPSPPASATQARPLRRPKPPEKLPVSGAFAFCVYLNWEGWHKTPTHAILNAFHKLFTDHCK